MSSSSTASSPPTHTSQPAAPRHLSQTQGDRPKKASIACLACKQRKTRCSATTPCTACHSRGTQCVYDASADQRRKIANQRNLEELSRRENELQRHRLLLGGIIAMIRTNDEDVANHLIDVIRSNTPLPDLAGYVSNAMTIRRDLSNSYEQVSFDFGAIPAEGSTSPTLALSRPSQRDDRYSQHYLNNSPITVEAHPWTTLANSEVVSHLFSLYFTWQQPFFQFIDKSAFLAGYNSKDFTSRFCSRLLVHAILAHACLLSQRANGRSLQNQLFSKAKLQLEIESGRARMPTFQALLVMYQYEGDRGRDRLGRSYRYQAVDIYRRLGFAREQDKPEHFNDDEWRAVTMTIWGTFALDAMTSFFYGFSPSIKTPLVKRYFPEHSRFSLDTRGDTWTPYPKIRPARPIHLTKHMHALCDLAFIYQVISQLNETGDGAGVIRSTTQKRIEISRLLLEWSSSLDPDLRLNGSESPPHVYYLLAFYHLAHIILFRPLQEESNLLLPPDIGNLNEKIFGHATAAIDILWALRSNLTLEHSPGIALICPIVVAFTLVAHLNTSPHVHPSFTRASQAIYEHRHNLPVAPFILAGLVLLGRQYDVRFTEQDKQYLENLNFPPEALSNVPMDLPILLDIGDNESERGELKFDSMGDFLAQWTNLSLGVPESGSAFGRSDIGVEKGEEGPEVP